MNLEDTNDIRAKDLIVMVFLKTKYWGLFRDIEANRDLYTQIHFDDRRFSLLIDDHREEEYRKKHFNGLFERLGYSDSDTEMLRAVLNETFPGWNGRSNIDDDDLLAAKRIAHRDLLDLYFSYGISHQIFKKHMEEVSKVVDQVTKNKYTEKTLTRQFRQFNRYALKQEQVSDVSRLLARRLLRLHQEQEAVPIVVWRCWLHALLSYEKGKNEATNSLLASILSGANDSIQRTVPLDTSSRTDMAKTIDFRVDLSAELFKNVTDALVDPYLALLMLLFVLPDRGNSFFLDYINRHGFQELFVPVLDYVDSYFIDSKRNVFDEYSWPQWSLVLFQWSFSISQGSINKKVPGYVERHKRVNNYVFSILQNDARLTYEFIKSQFWSDDTWAGEPHRWQVSNKIAQYEDKTDRENLISIVDAALSSKVLKAGEKKELEEFRRLLAKLANSTETDEAESV